MILTQRSVRCSRIERLVLLSIRFWTIILAVLLFGLPTFAEPNANDAPPIAVGIFDGPVDLSHPDLQNAIDPDLLRRIFIIDERGRKTSLYDAHAEMRSRLSSNLSGPSRQLKEDFEKAFAMRRAIDRLVSPTIKLDELRTHAATYLRGVNVWMADPRFYFMGLVLNQTLYHGTFIADLTARSLPKARLIPFPVSHPASRRLKLMDLLRIELGVPDSRLKAVLDKLTTVIAENEIRVVNLSLSINRDRWFSNAMLRPKSLPARAALKAFGPKILLPIAEKAADREIEILHEFFRNNPKTIFVLAAGNNASDLEEYLHHSTKIKLPNVVTVAATDDRGELAHYSSWSSTYVTIAAPGEGPFAACAGATRSRGRGTCTAAPLVTNALTEILTENPTLSPADAVETLYRERTTTLPSLVDRIESGRFLMPKDASQWNFLKPIVVQAEYDNDPQTGMDEIIEAYETLMRALSIPELELNMVRSGQLVGSVHFKLVKHDTENEKGEVTYVREGSIFKDGPVMADSTSKSGALAHTPKAMACQHVFASPARR